MTRGVEAPLGDRESTFSCRAARLLFLWLQTSFLSLLITNSRHGVKIKSDGRIMRKLGRSEKERHDFDSEPSELSDLVMEWKAGSMILSEFSGRKLNCEEKLLSLNARSLLNSSNWSDLKKITRLILSVVCWSLWIQMWSSDSRWAVGAEKRIRFLSESSTLSSWYLDQSSFVSSCRMKRSSRAGSDPSDFCSDVTCSQISTQPVWSLCRWQKQKRWRSYKNNKPRLKLTKYKRNRKKGSINK